MKRKRLKTLTKDSLARVIVLVALGVFGIALIWPTSAATVAVAIEAEDGQLADALPVQSQGASGGVAVSFAAAAAGPALYVAASGSDSNDGTQASPFRTIQKAANTATPGMTVHVGPGAYADPLQLTKSGTDQAWIRYVSDVRYGAVIGGEVNMEAEYNQIEGFDITNPTIKDGMGVTASNVVIKGNRFHNIHKFEPNENGGSGLTVYTDDYGPLENVVVDANRVYDIGLNPGSNSLVQGIYISIPCQGCKVTNNLVYQVADFGIHAYHEPRYWLVANNTVFNNGRGILTGPDFTIINNISLNNRSDNYDIRGTAAMTNNLAFGTGSDAMSGVIVADPQFVNYQADGSGDYRLKAASPGLHRGTSNKAPATDIDGAARPQGSGFDIGAYEQ